MNYFKKRVRLELDLQFYKHDLDNTSYKETEITDLIEEVLNGTFDRHLLAERYCGPFYVEHIIVESLLPILRILQSKNLYLIVERFLR